MGRQFCFEINWPLAVTVNVLIVGAQCLGKDSYRNGRKNYHTDLWKFESFYVQMMLKWFFDYLHWFQTLKDQCVSGPSIPVAVLGLGNFARLSLKYAIYGWPAI